MQLGAQCTVAPATTVAATTALATASAVFVPAACLVASVGFGVLGAWKLLDFFARASCLPVEFHGFMLGAPLIEICVEAASEGPQQSSRVISLFAYLAVVAALPWWSET